MVRQAHPGERRGAYRSDEQKLADAREFQREEGIAWPVLADGLDAAVHRAYGGMSDPVYLVDAAGRVAFYGMWIDGPRLRWAIEELLARGGVGVVAGGVDRRPHLAAAFVEGWRTMSRGGRRAVAEMAAAWPPVTLLLLLGNLARPALRPLLVRAEPMPVRARLALAGGVAAAGAVAVRSWRRPEKGRRRSRRRTRR